MFGRAHGQSFHTSIWHISMTGITDEAYVEQVLLKYDEVCFYLNPRDSSIQKFNSIVKLLCFGIS
jgi:Muskelin N-terminus